VRWDNTVLRDPSGAVVGTASLGVDMTEERAAAVAMQRLTAILDAAPDAVALVSTDGAVPYLNPAARRLFAVDAPTDVVGRLGALDPRLARDPERGAPMRAAVREGTWTAETTIVGPGGAEIPVEQTILAHRGADGRVEHFSTILHDIRERRRVEAELQALSLIDELTGLHNRRGFLTLADHALRVLQREATPSLLVYVDLNAFKAVNDTWGHAEGDAALQRVADVLRRTFRESDVIGRLGGDEFVVLAALAGEHEVALRARLDAEVARENARAGKPYALSLGVGTARVDNTGSGGASAMPLAALMARADDALYTAKRNRSAAVSVAR
ncbi:MAG: diguanylate cyclase, partial [Gemmatirosa sp.]|nr:diguanylate cyclase [Gemmatirosa sp.]